MNILRESIYTKKISNYVQIFEICKFSLYVLKFDYFNNYTFNYNKKTILGHKTLQMFYMKNEELYFSNYFSFKI